MLRRALLATVVVVALSSAIVLGTNVASVDGDTTPALTELLGPTDPLAGDTDGDGLKDGWERHGITDPVTADTDGDGVDDGDEVLGPTNATVADTDGDGLDDGREIEIGTDPAVADTDADGLNDGAEVETGTDPTVADTDADGLEDGTEAAVGTNPTVGDTDADGLEDGFEHDRGVDPTVADTDEDGLEDGREFDVGTNPVASDTDNDRLEDGPEVDLGTDPTATDTDGDGIPDGHEVHATELFPNADPLGTDVYVELDYMSGSKPSEEAIRAVVDAYANAPVENPDGSTGIALHVRFDDAVDYESPLPWRADDASTTDAQTYYRQHADCSGWGYHYALALEEVTHDAGPVAGLSSGERAFLVFETGSTEGRTSSLFMHEVGHSVGLGASVYEGIDSRDVSYEEYSSVMNYNAPSEAVEYSDGEPFDDWAYIAENLYEPDGVYLVTRDPSPCLPG